MKGFEVALLLGAVVIRDVYFGSMKEIFHLTSKRQGSGASPVLATPAIASTQSYALGRTVSPQQADRIPPTDPRSQWEIDQETERLRKEAAEEERQRRKREEVEERQIRKMLEEEEKERRRREAEVNAETERLRRMYGQEEQQVPILHVPQPYHRHSHSGPPDQSAYGYQQAMPGSYVAGPAPQNLLPPDQQQPKLKEKSSFFGFRRHSDQDGSKIAKKKSTMW